MFAPSAYELETSEFVSSVLLTALVLVLCDLIRISSTGA